METKVNSANFDEIIDGIYLSSMAAAFNWDLLQIINIKGILTVANKIEPIFSDKI